MIFRTSNIYDKQKTLKRTVKGITETPTQDDTFGFINEKELHYIIVQKYVKTFQTKDVDEENENGYFIIYRRLIKRLSKVISNYKPTSQHLMTTTNMVVQGFLKQNFQHEHFPQLSDFDGQEKEPVSCFFQHLIFLNHYNRNVYE